MTFQDINNKGYTDVFFVFSMVEVLTCSGIIYGWASIVYVFKLENFYMYLCNKPTTTSFINTVNSSSSNISYVSGKIIVGEDGLPGCIAQDSVFNLIFTVAVVIYTFVLFPAGLCIDKYGPRVVRYICGSMYFLSCLALGFVDIGYEWLLFPVFTIICVTGGVLGVTAYQTTNIIFRQHRSRVICLVNGAFDSSAAMLLILKVIYDRGIHYKYIMFAYATFCAVLNGFGTIFLIPNKKVLVGWSEDEKVILNGEISNTDESGPDFMTKSLDASCNLSKKQSIHFYKPDKADTEGQDLPMEKMINSNFQKEENYKYIDEKNAINDDTDDESPLVETTSSEESVWASILSPLYLFELMYLCTFQLKIWYMVGALAEDLVRLTDNDKNLVSKYIEIFGYVQFGGILITPIIGVIFDKDKLGKEKQTLILSPEKAHIKRLRECILPFAVTACLCILLSIISTIQNLKLQVLSFILYMIVRGFLYASHGAYIGTAFPSSQFATLYGFSIFIAGVFGSLQYALFQLKSGPLDGNPLFVNVILLVMVIIGSYHPVYLWWYCRRETKKLNAIGK